MSVAEESLPNSELLVEVNRENDAQIPAPAPGPEPMDVGDDAEIIHAKRRASSASEDAVNKAPTSSSSRRGSQQQQQQCPIHHLKTVDWHDVRVKIVTQNENGPCPLVAICNVLLLNGKLKLNRDTDVVYASELVDMVANLIIESYPEVRTPSLPFQKVLNSRSIYPPITYYWTVPLILDCSYLVGKSASSKIADTKVSGF
jgi:hypothetical protein